MSEWPCMYMCFLPLSPPGAPLRYREVACNVDRIHKDAADHMHCTPRDRGKSTKDEGAWSQRPHFEHDEPGVSGSRIPCTVPRKGSVLGPPLLLPLPDSPLPDHCLDDASWTLLPDPPPPPRSRGSLSQTWTCTFHPLLTRHLSMLQLGCRG